MTKQTKIIRINNARHMVITPKARVSFPSVFTPKSFQDNPSLTKSFSVDLLFTEEALKIPGKGKNGPTPSLLQAVNNVKRDQWGPEKEKWPRFNYPVFKKGDERKNRDGEVYLGYEGMYFITARCGEKFPPKVLDRFGRVITDEREFYGGCYAQAQLIARPYDFGGNRGVRFLLLGLMKVEDGERFGGFGDSSDAFMIEESASFEGGQIDGSTEDGIDEDFG